MHIDRTSAIFFMRLQETIIISKTAYENCSSIIAATSKSVRNRGLHNTQLASSGSAFSFTKRIRQRLFKSIPISE